MVQASPSIAARLHPPVLLPPDDIGVRPVRSSNGQWWFTLLGCVLLGYALLGKGWAYVGMPPLFIGEITLLLGLAVVLRWGRWNGLTRHAPFYFLAVLGVWGLYRTIPYIKTYGFDAVRDTVIWGYAAMAVVVYGFFVARPSRLGLILPRYGRFARLFLMAMPVVWAISMLFDSALPRWPWAPDVPIIHAKGGDVLVHLAGIVAFATVGAAGKLWRWWQTVLLALLVGAVGVYNRGGFVTVIGVSAFCGLVVGVHPFFRRLIGIAALVLLVMLSTGFEVRLPGKDRVISVSQIFINSVSIFVEEEKSGNLSGTKAWRLNWWGDIVDYTVHGPYFWTGKGFGVNLADDDGYQGDDWEGKLRSPHNGHITMLARAGVPGFSLWALLHISWAMTVGMAILRARAARQVQWQRLLLFLMAYWLAFIINASFDVFLEGPMGGIWFWSIFGAGLAAVEVHRRCPEALADGLGTPRRI